VIYGIGIDAVDIERVAHWSSDNDLLSFVFTATEIREAFNKGLSHKHFACVFALKESFMKAVGIGWNKEIRWNDIEIVKESGNFNIVLYNKANELCVGKKVLASCSCSKKLATAFVMILDV